MAVYTDAMSNTFPPGRRSEFTDDASAALSARRDLGPEYDDAIAASLADRVEQIVSARTSQPAQQIQPYQATVPERKEKSRRENATASNHSFVLGIVSLGTGIPITAIATEGAGLAGLLISWVGIVGVNVAHEVTQRRIRRQKDQR